MGDKESGKRVEEKSGRRFRGPRGNLTNSSTRAEGISEASEGQMQLRERANQKVNKAAGPHGSDGMPANHDWLDGRTAAARRRESELFFPRKGHGSAKDG